MVDIPFFPYAFDNLFSFFKKAKTESVNNIR
jgi:hypothetical protein